MKIHAKFNCKKINGYNLYNKNCNNIFEQYKYQLII